MINSAALDPRVIDYIKEKVGSKKSPRRLSNEILELFQQSVDPIVVHTIKKDFQKEAAKEKKRGASGHFSEAVTKKSTKNKGFDEARGDFIFKAQTPKSLSKGKVYFLISVGFLEYQGQEATQVLGEDLKVHVFRSLQSSTAQQFKVTRSFPVAQFEKLEIRELATKEDMEKLLEKLERGTCRTSLKFLAHLLSPEKRKVEASKYTLSGNISVLADICCARFRDGNKAPSLANPSDEALSLLATEYSLLGGLSYQAALSLMSAKSGRDDFMKLMEETYNKARPVLSREGSLAPK